MKLNKILKTAEAIVKDQPLNVDEKIELLERKLNTKISHFEDSMATLHSIIIKLSDENSALKEENFVLKKTLANREPLPISLLDGIKEKIVQPIMREGQELAHLVFEEDSGKQSEEEHKLGSGQSESESNVKKIKIKAQTIEPETDFDKHKKSKDPIPKQEEKGHNPKEKTIKWMRQKFGLTPHIKEKPKIKAKKYSSRKK